MNIDIHARRRAREQQSRRKRQQIIPSLDPRLATRLAVQEQPSAADEALADAQIAAALRALHEQRLAKMGQPAGVVCPDEEDEL